MNTPQGPQDPRVPNQDGAAPRADQQQPGYGYPPPQQGYPYQVQSGAPQYSLLPQPYVPNPNEPSWSALADQHAAERRRKRLLLITGSVVSIAAIAAAAVFFLTASGSKDKKYDTTDRNSISATPSSAPSSGSPSSSTTLGSLSPTMRGSDLFAATTLPVNGQNFVRKTTSHESPCWKASEGGLGPVLDKNQCSEVVLATYTSGKDSVTVGVMAFPSATEANAAASGFKGRLVPLTGKAGIPNFCGKVSCAVTHAAHGRYVYSTIAGPNSGATGDKDSDSIAAGHGIAGYALSCLIEMR